MRLEIQAVEQEKEEQQAAATEQRLHTEVLQVHVSDLERARPPPGALEETAVAAAHIIS